MKNELNVQLSKAVLKELKDNRKWFLALGVSLVIFGGLATIFAYTSTIFTMVYLGLLLIIVGGAEVVKAFKVRGSFGMFLAQLFFGALYAVVGVFIISNPIINAVTLTLLFAILFISFGIVRIIIALLTNAPHRAYLLVNGIITLILGILIWQQWPASGLWIIGLFVGINALFTGLSWIMLSSKLKKIKA